MSASFLGGLSRSIEGDISNVHEKGHYHCGATASAISVDIPRRLENASSRRKGSARFAHPFPSQQDRRREPGGDMMAVMLETAKLPKRAVDAIDSLHQDSVFQLGNIHEKVVEVPILLDFVREYDYWQADRGGKTATVEVRVEKH